MIATPTKIEDAWILEPIIHSDNRGSFAETWNMDTFKDMLGIDTNFKQMNQSISTQNVLRGLHYQFKHPQAKLVWVNSGVALDVFVDLRKNSPTYGLWDSYTFFNKNSLVYIPEGCAHGFYAKTESVVFQYLVSDYRYPEYERTIVWNDPTLNIRWGTEHPIISEKDRKGKFFLEAMKEWD